MGGEVKHVTELETEMLDALKDAHTSLLAYKLETRHPIAYGQEGLRQGNGGYCEGGMEMSVQTFTPSSASLWFNYQAVRKNYNQQAVIAAVGMLRWFALYCSNDETKHMAKVMLQKIERDMVKSLRKA